jgi:probable HAF family extracellular repeat protein
MTHGFLFMGTDYTALANYTQLDAPFATVIDINGVHPGTTYANGINNSDQVVGYVNDGSGNTHGFVYDGGAFTEIDVPTAADTFGSTVFGTQVSGIDSAGNLVGTFTDDLGSHGFIATLSQAPEPASLAIFGVGLAGLTGVYRRRARGSFRAG